MANVQHIHQVIFLIEKNNTIWTPKGLVEGVVAEWGEDIQFSSCSGVPFPKEQALEFLLGRQKVIVTEEGLVALHPSMQICEGHKTFKAENVQ